MRQDFGELLRGLVISLALIASGMSSQLAHAATDFYGSIDSARLIDQAGKPVGTPSLAGHTVLVQFIFTQCSSVCPVQTRALAELQASLPADLKRRVRFLSLSLDSLSDTPAQLRAYARRFGIDESSWTLATGRPEGIERLATTLRLYGASATPYKLEEHSTSLWLVDGHGQVLQRYAGNTPDLGRLRSEIAQADALSRSRGPRR